jgi:tRNA(Ile)-lysidine synthase
LFFVVDWLAQYLARAPAGCFAPQVQYALAASGGADSTFLLRVFAAAFQAGAIPRAPLVFHLHHGLRASADRDLEFTGDLARSLDLPFYYERTDVARFARRSGLGVEAAGRRLRYRGLARLLAPFSAACAVTAHHANDYLESLLIHLIRGGGEGALATLPLFSQVEGVWTLRPLVYFDGATIRSLLAAGGQAWVEDPTNQSDEYLRNRLRAGPASELLQEGLDPVKLWRNFHGRSELDLAGLARLGEYAQDPLDAPGARPDYLYLDRRLIFGALAEDRKRCLDPALRRLGLAPTDERVLAEIERRTAAGRTRLVYERPEWKLWSDGRGPLWLFRADARALAPPEILPRSGDSSRVRVRFNRQEREYDLGPEETFAQFRPGLRCPLPGGGSSLLSDVLQRAGLPGPVRRNLPLILGADGERVRRVCFSFWEGGRDREFPPTVRRAE